MIRHLYHHARRVTTTLVEQKIINKTTIVKEQLLFDMAKKQAMEDEQDRLMRDMMRRIEYIPMPKVEYNHRVMYV